MDMRVDGMIFELNTNTISRIKNTALIDYAALHASIEKNTLEAIESFGLPLEKDNSGQKEQEKRQQLKQKGAWFRNNEHSIISNKKISSACEACQTGTGSYTTFISLKCHRDCYFCFNKNQDNYSFYTNQLKNTTKEITDLVENGVHLDHLALTGGEPLLHKEEAIHFFQLANELTPETYTRLYTAGDLLDEETLIRLKRVRLNEIRFSIKLDDSKQKQKHILGKIELAREYIPNVLVEMPVIPGTLDEMKELLLTLDKMGIFGINLLEFCFPLDNSKAFSDRGYRLKNPPYQVYYNYWYAGGLAVAESEQICLDLVQFAIEQELQLGVHYCSLENKFTGQIYQQNIGEDLGEIYDFSNKDYFFKTAKVFGSDQNKVKSILVKNQIPYEVHSEYRYIQFPIKAIELMKYKDIDIVISSNVIEMVGDEKDIHEVKIEWTKPVLYKKNDL